jgi:prepilin-type N-terminal cleavage/methylation domain-containing protein
VTVARFRDERGFTLVELLVTMTILSVVMALITGTAIFLQRSINETDQRYDDLAQARLAMDTTTKWVRSAITVDPFTQPFNVARPSQVRLLANVDVAGGVPPQLVDLRVVNGALQEQVWTGTINGSGDWQVASATPRTRTIAHGVTSTTPFTFFDADGNDITPATDRLLTQAEMELVRRVGFAVTVQQQPNLDVPPSQLRNRVVLPNQFYFDQEEGA